MQFRLNSRIALAAFAMTLGGSAAACNHNHEYYNPYTNQYVVWDGREDVAYRRWEAERHYDHMEYRIRRADEQHAYWEWRHDHQ